jgi:hypothetical protein
MPFFLPLSVSLTLPLKDHALELVVDEKDLDTDIILRCGGKFHGSHGERRVAIDVNDNLFGCSNLCTNRCRDTVAHSLNEDDLL